MDMNKRYFQQIKSVFKNDQPAVTPEPEVTHTDIPTTSSNVPAQTVSNIRSVLSNFFNKGE